MEALTLVRLRFIRGANPCGALSYDCLIPIVKNYCNNFLDSYAALLAFSRC